MIKMLSKFHERDISNYFLSQIVVNAGAPLTRDTSDTSPIGIGDRPYGNIALGSVTVAGDKELGFALYPVIAGQIPLFNLLAAILTYESVEGAPLAVWHAPSGAILETDAFLASGTGHLVAGQSSGNTAIDTQLGIISGQYVVLQGSGAGSVPRAKLIGNGVNNGVQCIRVIVY